jgi:chromosome segregation ATPase
MDQLRRKVEYQRELEKQIRLLEGNIQSMHNDRQQFSLQKETELQALAAKLEQGAAIEASLAAQMAEASKQTAAVKDELNTAKQLLATEIARVAALEAVTSEARMMQSRVKDEWADRQQEMESLKIRRHTNAVVVKDNLATFLIKLPISVKVTCVCVSVFLTKFVLNRDCVSARCMRYAGVFNLLSGCFFRFREELLKENSELRAKVETLRRELEEERQKLTQVETLRRELEEERQKLTQLETGREELIAQHTKQMQLAGRARTKAKQDADAAAAAAVEAHKQELEAARAAHATQLETLTAELEAARAVQASSGADSAEVETLRRQLEEEKQKQTIKVKQLVAHMRTKAKQEADAAAAVVREEFDRALSASSSECKELQVPVCVWVWVRACASYGRGTSHLGHASSVLS